MQPMMRRKLAMVMIWTMRMGTTGTLKRRRIMRVMTALATVIATVIAIATVMVIVPVVLRKMVMVFSIVTVTKTTMKPTSR